MPLSLVPRNLRAHPVRTLLTLGSILIAVFLVCVLRTIVVSLGAGVEAASSERLVVQSAVSLFVNLPESYQARIEGVEGVGPVAKWQWFGGIYQDPSNFFAQFGVDADTLTDLYPEIEVVEGSEEEFVRARDTCLIGSDLAKKFGWKVGTAVPLIGTIFRRTDGTTWTFRVAGIYRSTKATTDNGTLFFHYHYLSEALEAGAAEGPPGVGVYVLRVEPGGRPEAVMRRVDALFENGPQRVQTTTEAEFQRQFVSMLGNVPTLLGSIGAGVLFAILLAALNTMLMAARERTRELGVLKAIGFRDGALANLLLVESLVLCGLGGALGVGLAVGLSPVMGAGFGAFLPGFAIGADSVALGFGLSLVVGLVAGLVPAWRARRLVAIDALRAV